MQNYEFYFRMTNFSLDFPNFALEIEKSCRLGFIK